jgi:hypothetical protein
MHLQKMKNTKFVGVALLLLNSFISGCGSSSGSGPAPVVTASASPSPTPTVNQGTILSVWTAIDPTSPMPTLDFSSYTLNEEVAANTFIQCTGTLDSGAPQVNGVDPGYMEIQGTALSGQLQFGELAYVGETDANATLCQELANEAYVFSIQNDQLTLCSVDYGNCETYDPAVSQ